MLTRQKRNEDLTCTQSIHSCSIHNMQKAEATQVSTTKWKQNKQNKTAYQYNDNIRSQKNSSNTCYNRDALWTHYSGDRQWVNKTKRATYCMSPLT